MKYPVEPLTGVSIDVCASLVGDWKGLYGDQPVQEIWHAPLLGQMMGSFRWVKEGKVWLYEFAQLAEHEGGIVLRIKHFDADLVGWEEKDRAKVFDLVHRSEDRLVFRERKEEAFVWTIYDRSQSERLRVWFERDDKPHHVDNVFEYRREG